MRTAQLLGAILLLIGCTQTAQAWCPDVEHARSNCEAMDADSMPQIIEASFKLRHNARKGDAWTLHYVPEYSADPNLWQEPLAIEPPATTSSQSNKRDTQRVSQSIWFATGVAIGFNVLSVVAYTMLPKDITNWPGGAPDWTGLEENFTKGPQWDDDSPYWNYVGHPIGGSEYFLLARNRNFGFLGSFAYSAGMSAFFEFFIESAFERASYQDLIITPVAGSLLGELRYSAKMALINPRTGRADTTLGKIAVVVLDPIDALLDLF